MALKPFFIIQYHDLIGEKLMQYVKSTAESSIEPSEIIEGSEAVVATKVRTSFSTGLEDETDERLGRLALVAELATGLGASRKASSKELQVASYAPGSHYSVHLDAVKPAALTDFTRLVTTRKLTKSSIFLDRLR